MHTLESNFQLLERTKQEQLDAANDAIEQWENRCTELTSKIEEIQESYADSHLEELESAVAVLREELVSARATAELLANELSATHERLASAELREYESQQRVRVESQAAGEVNRRLAEVLNDLNGVQSELVTARSERDAHNRSLAEAKSAIEQANLTINEQKTLTAELDARLAEKSESLAAAEEKLSASVQEIQTMQDRASQSERELNDCQSIIGQLQNELREAYEALQSRVTDEISDKVSTLFAR